MSPHQIPFLDEELQALDKQVGPRREPRLLMAEQKAVTVVDERQVINLTANNYLALATDPRVKQAAIAAIEKYGVAVCSGRNDSGTTDMHRELETRIARFLRTQAAVVLGSNSEINMAVMGSLLSHGDVAVVDERSHESVSDGISIGGAERRTYRHVDMDSLRDTLQDIKGKGYRRVLISTPGVFPMGGNIAPLPQIVAWASEFGALSMVDDAHAVGVIGENGRGTVSHFGLEGKCDIQVGGFGKAPGVVGGYVGCSRQLRELIIRKSNAFLHSAPLPTGMVAACIAALDVLESDDGKRLILKAWENAKFFKKGLKDLGFVVPDYSQTPLIPIILNDSDKALRFSSRLFAEGIFVAPKGKNLRTIITAAHERSDLARALDAFGRIGKELGVLTP